jgi:magnesium chelatase family protein
MLAKVYSCAVVGLDGAIVEVEVDTTNGLPSFVDVGSKSQRRSRAYGKAGEAGGIRHPSPR